MPTRLDAHRRPVRAAVAVALALAALAAGCSGGSGAAPTVTASPGSAPVLQPGRPGEPNTTLTGPAATPVVTSTASAQDAGFLRDMIAHHAQAIVTVETVGDRFTDTQVASIASRIRDEQGPEIRAMATWLEAHGEEAPPEATNPRLSDHGGHRGMPGMASAAELEDLARAEGVEADRLFLRLMVRHHEGALTMVDDHARYPSDERVEEIGAEVASTQTKQIDQMNGMLERLG